MASRPVKKSASSPSDEAPSRGQVIRPSGLFSSEQSVGTALRETYFAFCRNMTGHLAREGVTLGMWFVLRELWKEDELSQAVIAKRTGTQAPSVVQVVHALERAGLVRRTRSESDRRVSRLCLTPEGKILEARLAHAVLPVNREALVGFSRSETAALLDMLRRLRLNASPATEDS